MCCLWNKQKLGGGWWEVHEWVSGCEGRIHCLVLPDFVSLVILRCICNILKMISFCWLLLYHLSKDINRTEKQLQNMQKSLNVKSLKRGNRLSFTSINERRVKSKWNYQPLHITWWKIASVNTTKPTKLCWPKISVLLSVWWKAMTILPAHGLTVGTRFQWPKQIPDRNDCSQLCKLQVQEFNLKQIVCFAIVSSLFCLSLDFVLCLLQWYSL